MSIYSKFGPSNPLTKQDVDPVDQCVGNTWFTKSGIPGARMQKDFCPRFMAQRCANNWDEYCEAYLLTSNTDMAGNNFVNKEFLTQTAAKKYCRIDTDLPGSHCSLKCESFMPEGQTSVNICEPSGAFNWVDTKKEADLAGNFPQSARLTQLSPLYLNSCPETCDMKNTTTNPDALTADDPVLNKCLSNGTCNNVLMDLAYNVVKNNIPVSNPAFTKLIEYAKIEAPINPNSMVKIAQQFGISPEQAINVIEEAKYGPTPYQRRTQIQDKPYVPGPVKAELPVQLPIQQPKNEPAVIEVEKIVLSPPIVVNEATETNTLSPSIATLKKVIDDTYSRKHTRERRSTEGFNNSNNNNSPVAIKQSAGQVGLIIAGIIGALIVLYFIGKLILKGLKKDE
jgi:hypothetical protein